MSDGGAMGHPPLAVTSTPGNRRLVAVGKVLEPMATSWFQGVPLAAALAGAARKSVPIVHVVS
jgi:hypothetical protein